MFSKMNQDVNNRIQTMIQDVPKNGINVAQGVDKATNGMVGKVVNAVKKMNDQPQANQTAMQPNQTHETRQTHETKQTHETRQTHETKQPK